MNAIRSQAMGTQHKHTPPTHVYLFRNRIESHYMCSLLKAENCNFIPFFLPAAAFHSLSTFLLYSFFASFFVLCSTNQNECVCARVRQRFLTHLYNMWAYRAKTITETRVSTLAMMLTTTTHRHKLHQVIVRTNRVFIRQKGNVCYRRHKILLYMKSTKFIFPLLSHRTFSLLLCAHPVVVSVRV